MKTPSSRGVLLDTSAVLAFLEDETGAGRVAALLRDAAARRRRVALSAMTLFELYAVLLRRANRQSAGDAVMTVKSWHLDVVYPRERVLLAAGRLKAGFHLSSMDAIIAATASDEGLTLVHRDPEFNAVPEAALQAELLR